MSNVLEFLKKSWVLIVIGLGAFLVSCSSDSVSRDSSGNLISAGYIELNQIRVGDCIDESPVTNPDERVSVYDFWATPCSEEHSLEVYHIYDLSNIYRSYPGQNIIDEEGSEVCYTNFFDFVGTTYEESIYEINFYFPYAENWIEGNTKIICLLYDPSKKVSIGSKRNSRR
tara:strand:+ start:9063 stop:9575 length:513 start_codon:yes stop_codon:yes gene_type:complete